MSKKVSIIDYGLGNIVSVKQSFLKVIKDNSLDIEVLITNNTSEVKSSSYIILPGQGAFKSCIEGLKNINGMIEALEESVLVNKTPFLGICVGMQLLADFSCENGKHNGLGWINGSIKKITGNNIKLPHMGWNNIKIKNDISKIFKKDEKKDFYFVHSYYFDCNNEKNIVGVTNYGLNFTSIVVKENIYGVQFHPEKSSKQGLEILERFLVSSQ